jgi:acetoin utilization protein AcuB
MSKNDVSTSVQMNMTSKIITINLNETLEVAYQRMQKKKLRHLPVCDDTGEIIGMLSDRDIQRGMISQIVDKSEEIRFDPESRVKDYMAWPVLSVDQFCDLRLVAERMLTEKVSAFLVKGSKHFVGIITTDDMLKVLIDLLKDLLLF